MSLGSHGDGPGLPPIPLLFGILLALAVSVGLVWLVGGTSLVALAYGGALLTVLLTLLLAARLKTPEETAQLTQPDWAVTAAAIENRRRAVAIIDRANRLVCANATYEAWFGGQGAPHEISLDEASRKRLADAARQAWREGSAETDELSTPTRDRSFITFA